MKKSYTEHRAPETFEHSLCIPPSLLLSPSDIAISCAILFNAWFQVPIQTWPLSFPWASPVFHSLKCRGLKLNSLPTVDWPAQNGIKLSLLSSGIIDAVSESVFLGNMSHCWLIMACSLIKAKSFSTNAQHSWVLLSYTSILTALIRTWPGQVTGGGYLILFQPEPFCLGKPTLVPSLRSLYVYSIYIYTNHTVKRLGNAWNLVIYISMYIGPISLEWPQPSSARPLWTGTSSSVCHLAEQLRGKEDTVSVSIIQLPCPGKELFSERGN